MLNFPGGPGVGTPSSTIEGAGLIPGQGTKIPHADGKKEEIMVILMVLSGRFMHDNFLYFSNF